MLRTADLDYELPEALIATVPADPRDSARLLVVSRTDASLLQHRTVQELDEVLRPVALRSGVGALARDLMVVNTTRVLPARFRGTRMDTRGHVEGLYVGPGQAAAGTGPRWTVLLKMRRMKPGVVVALHDRTGGDSGLRLRLIERTGSGTADTGGWIVELDHAEGVDESALDRIGLTPLPPYILAARKKHHLEVADDLDRAAYQTVYAGVAGSESRPTRGSVAAPTAGLHFTPDLLDRLQRAGVERADAELAVGLGTFKPVETEFVERHPMHAEWCRIPPETANAIRTQRTRSVSDGPGRIIAVGTTAARTLESFDNPEEMLAVGAKETRLLITPGFRFKHVDALLTNFHLPRSTLMALVAAFLAPPEVPAAGAERLKAIYLEAVRECYRFYSYGDAMLVLP